MAVEIIINATREETRVALLENKTVTEMYIDRKKDRGLIGNVYKGRVVKVLPGMQAAFVDIGMGKSAFLHVDDVAIPLEDSNLEDSNQVMGEEEAGEKVEFETETAQQESEPAEGEGETARRKRASRPPIEDLLTEGQEIIVQVSKEPVGTKGPRITTYLSLPGRYLVFMPTVNHVGVSRRIQKEEERARLKEMLLRMRRPGAGYIIRTVSEGIGEEEFKSDLEFLDLLWQALLKKKEALPVPALLHTDLDLSFRVIRDLFTKKVDRLVIDSKEEFQRIKEFMDAYISELAPRVELYDREEPIFDAFEIEIEVGRALGRKVWLKSGGYIVIDHTEALTVIDVNTGRYVGKRDLEETILKTNLEAVKEISYQLRFRNIGGIIIIDLIDMEKQRNREKVFYTLIEAARSDRAKTNILRISELGLVEMSRERMREDIKSILCEPCTYCEGKGYTKSPTTICYSIFREIQRAAPAQSAAKIIVSVHPAVANLLSDEERQGLEEIEREYRKEIVVKADSSLHVEQYDIAFL